jgi:hypothetical protein
MPMGSLKAGEPGATKETALVLIPPGALFCFGIRWRHSLIILKVPLNYFLIHSAMPMGFRYTLPLPSFLFLFAAIGWGLVGGLAGHGTKRFFGRWRRGPARF